MDPVFFLDDWNAVLRILLVGTLGYVWIVFLLRGTGPRTIAKMTPFDFVITVTLGSAFGRVITAKEVGLVEVLVTFALLVTLQWSFAIARARWRVFAGLVDVSPALIAYREQPVERALRRHRLTEADLHSALRENGRGSLAGVEAVILQSDGTFSVIGAEKFGDGSSVLPFAGPRRAG
jgi:uncharacterized membrane protein YcaP (DUF421 family)